MKKIAIFASGTGTNAQRIIDHFKHSGQVQVALILSNNPSAGVLEIAKKEGIPYIIIEREKFLNSNHYQHLLKENNIQWIVLAGFLWKIPAALISAYPQRIINIHPALLPKFGGKGMYGSKVHEAVIHSGDKESGITIHYVDEIYDHGKIIFQARSPISSDDDAVSLAKKIHELEYQHFPQVIERLLIDTKI
jgi:formyltetrahydrofolate-dependent phosphoribosylglycinamide formyltransferase